jgi:hypothetical protein
MIFKIFNKNPIPKKASKIFNRDSMPKRTITSNSNSYNNANDLTYKMKKHFHRSIHIMNHNLNKIIVGLIIACIVAVASAFWDGKIVKTKVEFLEKKQATVEKQIDDIHWFLIEKNNIKIPSR